jgi:hypothetical protein
MRPSVHGSNAANARITVTNTGQVAYTGATFTDPLSGVLDDATCSAA